MEIRVYYAKSVGADLKAEVQKMEHTSPYTSIPDESNSRVLVDLNEINELIRSLHEAKKVMKENMR